METGQVFRHVSVRGGGASVFDENKFKLTLLKTKTSEVRDNHLESTAYWKHVSLSQTGENDDRTSKITHTFLLTSETRARKLHEKMG